MKNLIEVKVKFLHPLWQEYPLAYATPGSAGLDLRACFNNKVQQVPSGERIRCPTGLALEIVTPGWAGFVFSRSGLGTAQGLVVTQGVGVIDPDYRGEIVVSLHNISQGVQKIVQGQRIAQLVFLPAAQARIEVVQSLADSERGSGGFGHTGNF